MAKILLVEDDENLREIYQARLTAEGYEIVSAKNGEEALVVAKQEKPDLIIADIMMPRISGFEMLDILRNTEGMKHVRVIMLTALGQAEDKARADKLGADRYLVKSQVTLEDIVHAAADLLGDQAAPASAPVGQAANAETQASVMAVPAPVPAAPTASPTPRPATAPTPAPQMPTTTPQTAPMPVVPAPTMPSQAPSAPTPVSSPAPAPQPAVPTTPHMPQATPTPIQQPQQQAPDNSGPTVPTQAPPTPGVPPIVPVSQPPQTQTLNQSAKQEPAAGSTPQTSNASQLANAVNNLLNGTGQQASTQAKPPTPSPAPTPQAAPQPQPSAPRAFPTGAPTVPTPAPTPEVKPPVNQPPKLAQPPADITQPQPVPTPAPAQPTTVSTPTSIAIKDKKSVEPLKTNQNIANADLNDLLKKETGQDSMSDANNDMGPDVMHQPGQVFMPTSGNSGVNDPNNIAL